MENKRVLLIEDNPDAVELTLQALLRSGINPDVTVAYDGAEALEYIFSSGRYSERSPEVPDIVFLDLKLPKVSGLEVLKAIRGDSRTRYLPVVILTASRQESDRAEGYRLGANSYVSKPVDFDKYIDAVRLLGLYWLGLNIPPPESLFVQ